MIWGGCVIFIVLIYWGAMYALYDTKQCSPWLKPNEFGDMFGVLSCLFSGLAFAGLIVTIRQQREDLELQRKELQRANQEAAAQTAQFEEQTKQFKEQIEISRLNQAKNEFYQRLSLLKQQESDIVYRYPSSLTEKKLYASKWNRGCCKILRKSRLPISRV